MLTQTRTKKKEKHPQFDLHASQFQFIKAIWRMSIKWYAYYPQTCREWQSADGNLKVYHSKTLNCADLQWIPLALVFRGLEQSLIREATHTASRCLIPAVWTAYRARESRILRNTSPAVNCCCASPPTREEKKAAAAAKQTTSRFSSRLSVGWVWDGNIGCRGEKFFSLQQNFRWTRTARGSLLGRKVQPLSGEKRKMVKWLVGFWRMETLIECGNGVKSFRR